MKNDKYTPSLRDIAYHEAAHTVAGYLFYTVDHVVIEPGESMGCSTHGVTKVNTPESHYLGEAEDRSNFLEYLKLIICFGGGRFMQYLISGVDDAAGAALDDEIVELHLYNKDNKFYTAFRLIASPITKDFFSDQRVMLMVATVAERLIIKPKLDKNEIHDLLKDHAIDHQEMLDMLCNRYYPAFMRMLQLSNF